MLICEAVGGKEEDLENTPVVFYHLSGALQYKSPINIHKKKINKYSHFHYDWTRPENVENDASSKQMQNCKIIFDVLLEVRHQELEFMLQNQHYLASSPFI